MMRFFGDVSGKDVHPIRVAAGYLGGPKHWRAFDREWQAALDEAEVKQFHATDFFTFNGEFENWALEKQVKFAKRFTAIAVSWPCSPPPVLPTSAHQQHAQSKNRPRCCF